MNTTDQSVAESEARNLASHPVLLERRLRQAASLLVNNYKVHFGPKAVFSEDGRTLVATTGRYQLRWQLRNKPDQPEGPDNQQTSVGVVHLEIHDRFHTSPN